MGRLKQFRRVAVRHEELAVISLAMVYGLAPVGELEQGRHQPVMITGLSHP